MFLSPLLSILEGMFVKDHINICTFIANFTLPFSTLVALISWFTVTPSPQLLGKVEEMEKFIWNFYLKRMILKPKSQINSICVLAQFNK